MQLRPLILSNVEEAVPGNKKFVGKTISDRLKPNQGWRYYCCVEPIDGEIVHSLGPGKRISIGINKAAIGAQFCDGAAGLNSSENIAVCVLLVLH